MMAEEKFNYRESLISHLRMIAAERPGDSFDELVCGWFDDLYLPGFDPDDYNTEVHEKGIIEFNRCFHAKELKALELFHQHFDAQIQLIPVDILYQDLATNEHWQNIRLAALRTLEAFNSLTKGGPV